MPFLELTKVEAEEICSKRSTFVHNKPPKHGLPIHDIRRDSKMLFRRAGISAHAAVRLATLLHTSYSKDDTFRIYQMQKQINELGLTTRVIVHHTGWRSEWSDYNTEFPYINICDAEGEHVGDFAF